MPSSPSPAVFIIKTFTLLSDFDEDRLRMNACDPAGMTQSMMLTRRLLDRALPAMIKACEAAAEGPIPASLTLPIAQEKLRLERRESPVPPVHAAPDAVPWLCTAMQFANREKGMVWVLKGRSGEEARMLLSNADLRAALDIFAAKYKAMDWSAALFPEWLAQRPADKPARPSALH